MIPTATGCTIDVTEECNLRCDYCFTHTKTHKKKTLNFSLGCDIIKWTLEDVNPQERDVNISYWGGEPLLEWEMCQRLTYYAEDIAKEKGLLNKIQFGGTTNGILYTPDKVEWCLRHKSLFLISLDGIQPAHDFHRKFANGKGSWKIVDKNIREALKITPMQRARLSFSAETIKYLFESIQYYSEDLGIADMAFSAVYESNWDDLALATLEEQLELIVNYMIKRLKEGNNIIIKHLNDEATSKRDGTIAENPCGAGGGYSGWSIDGFQFPCHRFNKHGISTQQKEKISTTIGRMLNGEYIDLHPEWRKQFYEYKDHPPDKCNECSIYKFSGCNGGCYGSNFDLTGNLCNPADVVCKHSKIINKMGLLLKKKAEEEKLFISSDTWNKPIKQGEPFKVGCVCYNMCYAEGTNKEMIHIDRRNDITCKCYQTQYIFDREELDARPITIIDNETKLQKKFLDLSKRIIQTRDNKKTEEQRKLENNILEKTINML